MTSKDTFVSVHSAPMPAYIDETEPHPCTRVAILTERHRLKIVMRRLFLSQRYLLTQVASIELINKAIKRKLCDVAIVDIERRDVWPCSMFARFDKIAVNFPIIILCRSRHNVPYYLSMAEHAVDIVPYEMINDRRFFALIEAAKFRTDMMGVDRRND